MAEPTIFFIVSRFSPLFPPPQSGGTPLRGRTSRLFLWFVALYITTQAINRYITFFDFASYRRGAALKR